MKALKPIAMAFLVGGIFAVIGQAITMFWLPILGGDSPFMGFAVLVSMGVIGVVMFLTGLHQKLAPIAGFGTILPFNGFCAAISDAYVSAANETEKSAAGVKAALGLVGYVLGWGCLFILVIAVVSFFVGGLI
ncbi:MAG: SpoVA/SpoVAEb family sporulation membrane protein [Eggerthellaceae bacterium]|nr:SpoVA/SpoVAEb family sporulation membrane protein [Eggerthellaceae bacterium]